MARTLSRSRLTRRTPVTLSEDVSPITEGLRVDRSKRVIRDVLLLGFKSKNGRRYTPEAMRDAVARGMYEGVRINLDHPESGPGAQRSIRDRLGKAVHARYDPKRGIVGDVRYLAKDPYAEKILEAAEEMPDVLGFSHNADGEEAIRDGIPTIERILRVRHVDLVSDPATAKSLYESIQPRKRRRRMATTKKKTRQVIEMDDPLAPDMSGGALDAPEEEEGGDIEEKIADLIEALIAEFRAGAMDLNQLKKRVGTVLGILKDDEGCDNDAPPPELDSEDDDESDDDGDDEPPPKKKDTEESVQEDEEDEMDSLRDVRNNPAVRKLLEQVDGYRAKARMARRRAHVRKALSEAKLPKDAITKTFLRLLEGTRDDKELKELLEDRKKAFGSRQPLSRGPGSNGAATMTAQDFARAIVR